MKAFDLKFVQLNEDEQVNNQETSDTQNKSTKDTGVIKDENNDNQDKTLTPELIDKAIEALENNQYNDDNVSKVAEEIFGEDNVILPTSDADTINKNADNFVKIAIDAGVNPDEENKEKETETSTEIKPKAEESYGANTFEGLLLEASNIEGKKKEFIEKLLDKILNANKAAQDNGALKKFHKKIKGAKDRKRNKDKKNKDDANGKSNTLKGAANINELKNSYKTAGEAFIAHTCTMTYKLLKNTNEKEQDLKILAQTMGKDNGEVDNYLKSINDINERKHIDAGACALALAQKYKEANKDKKSPYSAKNTKEATILASRYKKAFPKYYQNAYNILSDAYTEGIKSAQEKFRNGQELDDPITGEKVTSKVIAPLWEKGKNIKKWFQNDKLDFISLGPKLIFGVYDMLTGKTAKNIYSGLFKFGRAIYQKFKAQEKAAEVEDNKELFKCDEETLKNEFDEIVQQHSETKDDVDKSDDEGKQEQEQQPEEQKQEQSAEQDNTHEQEKK